MLCRMVRFVIPIPATRWLPVSKERLKHVVPHNTIALTRCHVSRSLSWGVFEHPLRFFENDKNTAARSEVGLSPTFSFMFSANFVKVLILGHARSDHQVRSSDLTTQKLKKNRSVTAIFEVKLHNVRNMIRVRWLLSTESISRIFIPQVRSFSWPPYYMSIGKNKLRPLLYASAGVYLNRIASHRAFIHTSIDIFRRWPLLQVIRGHQQLTSCTTWEFIIIWKPIIFQNFWAMLFKKGHSTTNQSKLYKNWHPHLSELYENWSMGYF